MDPNPPLSNGALSRSESERLKSQIHDTDRPRELADLSHLEPRDAERKSPTASIAVRGGRGGRRTATPPKRKEKTPSTGAGGAAAPGPHARRRSLHPSDERQARHPRDEALTPQEGASRLQSPDGRAGAAQQQQPAVDFDGLSWPSIGTKSRLEATPAESEARLKKLEGAVATILECVGEDPSREGLRLTPERFARAMMFFTKGYEENLRDIVNGAVFHEDHDELVIVKDIDIFSLCEHHLVPFTGKMHIGYIPSHRVIGLSKMARIAEMFARRLQVQERLTKQVALALNEVLEPRGVAVVVESSHLCMVMRGVEKATTKTVTSCMLGCMRSPRAKTREEFLKLINR